MIIDTKLIHTSNNADLEEQFFQFLQQYFLDEKLTDQEAIEKIELLNESNCSFFWKSTIVDFNDEISFHNDCTEHIYLKYVIIKLLYLQYRYPENLVLSQFSDKIYSDYEKIYFSSQFTTPEDYNSYVNVENKLYLKHNNSALLSLFKIQQKYLINFYDHHESLGNGEHQNIHINNLLLLQKNILQLLKEPYNFTFLDNQNFDYYLQFKNDYSSLTEDPFKDPFDRLIIETISLTIAETLFSHFIRYPEAQLLLTEKMPFFYHYIHILPRKHYQIFHTLLEQKHIDILSQYQHEDCFYLLLENLFKPDYIKYEKNNYKYVSSLIYKQINWNKLFNQNTNYSTLDRYLSYHLEQIPTNRPWVDLNNFKDLVLFLKQQYYDVVDNLLALKSNQPKIPTIKL